MSYLRCQDTLPKYFGHKSILEIAEPSTLFEMVLWEEEIPESEFLGFRFQILDDGGVGFETGFCTGVHAELGLEEGVGGYAFFFYEFLDLDRGRALDCMSRCRRNEDVAISSWKENTNVTVKTIRIIYDGGESGAR
jgi:hypothetical protein